MEGGGGGEDRLRMQREGLMWGRVHLGSRLVEPSGIRRRPEQSTVNVSPCMFKHNCLCTSVTEVKSKKSTVEVKGQGAAHVSLLASVAASLAESTPPVESDQIHKIKLPRSLCVCNITNVVVFVFPGREAATATNPAIRTAARRSR